MNGPFSRSRIFLQGLGVEKVQAQGFKCLLTHQIESLTQFLLGWLKVNKLAMEWKVTVWSQVKWKCAATFLFQFWSQTCLVCERLFSGEIEQNYGNFSLSTMNGDISLLGQNCARDAFQHISLSPHHNGHIFTRKTCFENHHIWTNWN